MRISPGFDYYPDIFGVRTRDDAFDTAAVEVKGTLLGLTRGLGQASLYQEFANYSWLALPKRTTLPASQAERVLPKTRVLPMFRRLGIGLLVFEHDNPSTIEEWILPVRQSPSLTVKWKEKSEKHTPDSAMREEPKRQSSATDQFDQEELDRQPAHFDYRAEFSKFVGLLIQNGPNINELARHLGLFKETVRYRYKRHLLARGFTLTAVPSYRKLGLDRLIFVAEFSPSFRPQIHTILATMRESCYVLGFEQTAIEGWFIIHAAVPNELVESCVEIFNRLQSLGVFSHLEVYKFQLARTPKMKHECFDFLKGVWSFEWPSEEEAPIIPFGEEQREKYDGVDLLILSQLQEDPSKSLSQISNRLGMSYRGLTWHHSKHIVERGLIDSYTVNWARTNHDSGKEQTSDSHREYLPICLLLTNADERARLTLRALVQRLPFLWFEASGVDYFASLYLPIEIASDFFYHLRDLDIDAQKLRCFIMNQSNSRSFTIPHHLFDRVSKKWRLDMPHIMEKFQNLLLRARNCEQQTTRS